MRASSLSCSTTPLLTGITCCRCAASPFKSWTRSLSFPLWAISWRVFLTVQWEWCIARRDGIARIPE